MGLLLAGRCGAPWWPLERTHWLHFSEMWWWQRCIFLWIQYIHTGSCGQDRHRRLWKAVEIVETVETVEAVEAVEAGRCAHPRCTAPLWSPADSGTALSRGGTARRCGRTEGRSDCSGGRSNLESRLGTQAALKHPHTITTWWSSLPRGSKPSDASSYHCSFQGAFTACVLLPLTPWWLTTRNRDSRGVNVEKIVCMWGSCYFISFQKSLNFKRACSKSKVKQPVRATVHYPSDAWSGAETLV